MSAAVILYLSCLIVLLSSNYDLFIRHDKADEFYDASWQTWEVSLIHRHVRPPLHSTLPALHLGVLCATLSKSPTSHIYIDLKGCRCCFERCTWRTRYVRHYARRGKRGDHTATGWVIRYQVGQRWASYMSILKIKMKSRTNEIIIFYCLSISNIMLITFLFPDLPIFYPS